MVAPRAEQARETAVLQGLPQGGEKCGRSFWTHVPNERFLV